MSRALGARLRAVAPAATNVLAGYLLVCVPFQLIGAWFLFGGMGLLLLTLAVLFAAGGFGLVAGAPWARRACAAAIAVQALAHPLDVLGHNSFPGIAGRHAVVTSAILDRSAAGGDVGFAAFGVVVAAAMTALLLASPAGAWRRSASRSP